jgi:hypothetical protein
MGGMRLLAGNTSEGPTGCRNSSSRRGESCPEPGACTVSRYCATIAGDAEFPSRHNWSLGYGSARKAGAPGSFSAPRSIRSTSWRDQTEGPVNVVFIAVNYPRRRAVPIPDDDRYGQEVGEWCNTITIVLHLSHADNSSPPHGDGDGRYRRRAG